MSMILSQADQDRIAQAVRAAEAATVGEIRCVIAPRVAPERPAPVLAWAAGAALLIPAFALLAGLRPEALTRLFGGWSVGHAAAQDGAILSALLVHLALQAGVFVAAAMLLSIPAIRLRLPAGESPARRVRRAAEAFFLSSDLRATRGRTGVLIFAALAEHRVEVLADEGIHGLAPEDAWSGVVADLVTGLKAGAVADGFVAAVGRAGTILAEHAPRDGGEDRNELPDAPTLLG
ncbi:MAG: TPM domain-containing protein [Caulobacter sp.]